MKFHRVLYIAFVTAATSLSGGQTLHVWPSPRLVHYIYIFGDSCPLMEFCLLQNSLYVQLLRSPILAALLHGTPPPSVSHDCSVVQGIELRNFRRGRHLYSAGRPSRWASAHILVCGVGSVTYTFRHFSTIQPVCAGRIDRGTDTGRQHIPR